MTITVENLFNRIAELHPSLPGWCSLEKSFTLASIIVAFRPAVVVEIGIYGGKSFMPMVMACAAVNHGLCIGIDPWSAEVAVREQTQEADRDWWAKLDYEKLRTEFMLKIQTQDLERFTRIERRESRFVEPPNAIGLFHCDGSHSDTATQDMMRFAPKVVAGGYCVTDDTEWHGGGVARGELRLKEMGFVRIQKLGTGAVFQRLSK